MDRATASEFHVASFSMDGELVGSGKWQISALSPQWLSFAQELLEVCGPTFDRVLPASLSHIRVKFTSFDQLALATFFVHGNVAISAILLSGKSPGAESQVQEMFLQSLRTSKPVIEFAASDAPFSELEHMPIRPLCAAVFFGTSGISEQDAGAAGEICNHLAGAFFQTGQ